MLIREGGIDDNGKRIRFDKHGNQIIVTQGTFSVANRKLQIMNKKKAAMSVNSDTGGAESPLKGDDSQAKKQRHRISFAD